MKVIQRLENEFCAEVMNADVFSVVNGWNIAYIESCGMFAKVVLSLEDNPDYTLDILYRKIGKKEEFTTNVATFGSFELLDASATAQYYMAVGSLLNHKVLLADLKKTMKEYVAKMKEIEKEEED